MRRRRRLPRLLDGFLSFYLFFILFPTRLIRFFSSIFLFFSQCSRTGDFATTKECVSHLSLPHSLSLRLVYSPKSGTSTLPTGDGFYISSRSRQRFTEYWQRLFNRTVFFSSRTHVHVLCALWFWHKWNQRIHIVVCVKSSACTVKKKKKLARTHTPGCNFFLFSRVHTLVHG
jgi:hypothetical protein